MREDAPYEVGKGKPPKNRRFGQPGGNPNGKTSNQKRAEMKAAEIAASLEARLLAALLAQSDAELVQSLTGGDITRMIKTAMDREYGTATQKVEASGANGGPIVMQWKNADS
jgi:hypothetical protein